MGHKLAGLPARPGNSHAEYGVVQARLQENQELLASYALHSGGLIEEVLELPFQQAVRVLGLLLFFELNGVLALPAAARLAVLAGGVRLSF
jgi:hypothetical protein